MRFVCFVGAILGEVADGVEGAAVDGLAFDDAEPDLDQLRREQIESKLKR